MRHLISSLERENISLAHVWPRTYPGTTPQTARTTCYWFVGLVVGGSAGAHLDLTSPIKNFTDIVMRSAIQINVWKEGMKIEAYYKKRKALSIYLPEAELWKLKSERKSSVATLNSPNGAAIKRVKGRLVKNVKWEGGWYIKMYFLSGIRLSALWILSSLGYSSLHKKCQVNRTSISWRRFFLVIQIQITEEKCTENKCKKKSQKQRVQFNAGVLVQTE